MKKLTSEDKQIIKDALHTVDAYRLQIDAIELKVQIELAKIHGLGGLGPYIVNGYPHQVRKHKSGYSLTVHNPRKAVELDDTEES